MAVSKLISGGRNVLKKSSGKLCVMFGFSATAFFNSNAHHSGQYPAGMRKWPFSVNSPGEISISPRYNISIISLEISIASFSVFG